MRICLIIPVTYGMLPAMITVSYKSLTHPQLLPVRASITSAAIRLPGHHHQHPNPQKGINTLPLYSGIVLNPIALKSPSKVNIVSIPYSFIKTALVQSVIESIWSVYFLNRRIALF